ncbi:hypothetical protein NHX12_025800 [Muraenolepis orangiensis]|uniref:Uncharacterized protein n=1 Tax=Muraenolepis orangiensis TaxID=630683 RepID=A0A9Q0IQ69_9TELE|nr:hypothetical protein NHX12_025800 [Muraenolepis orangiensis]
MSGVLGTPALRARLGALECHFTWELDNTRSNGLYLRDKLEDIGTDQGNPWLGHIYNLRAHIHFQLASQEDTPGSTLEDALRCFGMAAEALRQVRNTVSDEGPWLLVNYGNLAWLHYHMGEHAESLVYVGKVEALLREYPSPIQEQLHQEVLAEKAWTLMNFGPASKSKAVEYFTKAIEVEPDMVEWTTSHALALSISSKDPSPEQKANILKVLRRATERDPDNLYIVAVYLKRLAETGEAIEDQARKLAEKVLRRPQSLYSGIRPLLRLYRRYGSLDEAIDVAKEASDRHPNARHLKDCLARCYMWKVFSDDRDSLLIHSLRERAIVLYTEVVKLYPYTFLKAKISLAKLYAARHNKMESDETFKELLASHSEPPQLQMLYYKYATFLHFQLKDSYRSIEYHMKAAKIQHPSYFRTNSILILQQIKKRTNNREIEDFLAKLEEPITPQPKQ